MKKPCILHVGKFYPPASGGMETILETLCRDGSGTVENRALVMSKARHTVHQVLDGVAVTRVGRVATVGAVSIAPTLPMWLARTTADVIVLHEPNPMALVAFFLARPGLPLVVWYHSEVIRPRWRYQLFYQPFLEFALRRAERIVVGSPPMMEVAALAPYREKCVVIPFGLDVGRYQATPPVAARAAALRQSFDRPVLLFVGRLVPYKGVEVFLRALPGLHAQTVIVGDGPLRDVLSQMASELGLGDRVRFVGGVADEELLSWYYACDALVLPSTSRQEAFGLVQLEAMLCGRPVVSTNLPTGVPWVNQDEHTGLVVPPGDAAALRGALTRLVSDVELRRRLGETARTRVLSQFAAEDMRRAMRRVYQDICPEVFEARSREAAVMSPL
jgi:rhamnosyl/mannosyltransferase